MSFLNQSHDVCFVIDGCFCSYSADANADFETSGNMHYCTVRKTCKFSYEFPDDTDQQTETCANTRPPSWDSPFQTCQRKRQLLTNSALRFQFFLSLFNYYYLFILFIIYYIYLFIYFIIIIIIFFFGGGGLFFYFHVKCSFKF